MTVKQRAAPPAFQFYPSDWMSGAPARMSPDETHAYIWLLCLDWEYTGFEFDVKELAKWCRMTTRQFAKAWTKVGRSFIERDGRLYNPRLEKERAKQVGWLERCADGGRRGADKRWPQRQGTKQVANRSSTPPVTGTDTGTEYQNNTLQTSVKEVRSTSKTPSTSQGVSGALTGARTRDQHELEDINRRRVARGEDPVDAL